MLSTQGEYKRERKRERERERERGREREREMKIGNVTFNVISTLCVFPIFPRVSSSIKY
jgi:hypothetical protein